MNARRLFLCLCLSVLCLAAASPALGLANRVFVSARSGNNANSCDNINTPCQTFAGAVPKLNPGGEVIVLDSGGYGPVIITQSVTIEAPPGVLAFIHPPSGPAVQVNAGGAKVVLRGLTLNVGNADGIVWFGSGSLHVESCVINGFVRGLSALPFEVSRLFVKDTIIRGNSLDGILLQPTAGLLTVSIDRCRVEDNGQFGVSLKSSSIAFVEALVRETVLASNFSAGLLAESLSGGTAHAFADRCAVSSNLNTGIGAQGAGAALRVQGSSIAYNLTGLYNVGDGAVVETIGNNMVRNNTFNKFGTITVQPGD